MPATARRAARVRWTGHPEKQRDGRRGTEPSTGWLLALILFVIGLGILVELL